MITVPIKIKDYAISMAHLASLAEEYFGKVLDVTGEESDTIEFGFEGDALAASFEGMTLEGFANKTAAGFAALLNTPSWKIKPESA